MLCFGIIIFRFMNSQGLKVRNKDIIYCSQSENGDQKISTTKRVIVNISTLDAFLSMKFCLVCCYPELL